MKIGLVLEGGAMRGMFTAGVLDVMMEENINVDGIMGVSAGALFGANYFSNQKGRVIRYSKRFAKDRRYISLFNLIFTGNIVSKNFAYYKMNEKLDPFDTKTFKENNKDFWAVVTNIETGKPEYLKIEEPLKDMEIFRATSAMPLVTKPVVINGQKYLDGAVSDSIPIKKMMEKGYDKVVVVLTRPLNYQKNKLSDKKINMIHRKFQKYPNLINAMENRYQNYNETTELIKKLESENKIFVIRPQTSIDVKVIERDKNKLQNVYDMGIEEMKKNLRKLKEYLEIGKED